jgi:transcriptional regulator GlxA family with amidase domain
MRTAFPEVAVDQVHHWVEDGKVLTSAGIAAGIDLALVIVSKLFSESVARATARHMEYLFPDSDARRV